MYIYIFDIQVTLREQESDLQDEMDEYDLPQDVHNDWFGDDDQNRFNKNMYRVHEVL